MPIYAYKCAACGHEKDVLQKVSDAPLTICPDCGEAAFSKQITAAGFQLKGSGWYVTDFRNGSKKPNGKADGSADGKADGKSDGDAKGGGQATGSGAQAGSGQPAACGSGGCPAC